MITGGLGNDILVGGYGEDSFIFSANAGEGFDTIEDFNTAEDTLSFADLLDEGAVGLEDDLAAYASTIDVTVLGPDLVLNVPDQNNPNGTPTEITLANLGGDYTVGSGTTLADLMDPSLANTIDVDTYAS